MTTHVLNKDVNSICHVNRISVLASEYDGYDSDVDCNASVLVEVSDECQGPLVKACVSRLFLKMFQKVRTCLICQIK